ncbi:MAG: 50S ribosomal protein L13 [Candidatus Stahlbacteria bacterium]|nr:50S ribosomal protein L13 [Candidatus Stahlbacteria bacterium]
MKSNWVLIDAENQTLGRLATGIAQILMGKNKPTYVPWRDENNFVVCINADKIVVTGSKETDKLYKRFSGYPSGLKITSLNRMRKEHPEHIIHHAVSGMLPKNHLRDKRLKRFKIYTGSEHPHKAQSPVRITIDEKLGNMKVGV